MIRLTKLELAYETFRPLLSKGIPAAEVYQHVDDFIEDEFYQGTDVLNFLWEAMPYLNYEGNCEDFCKLLEDAQTLDGEAWETCQELATDMIYGLAADLKKASEIRA